MKNYNRDEHQVSPHYWVCVCEFPEAVHPVYVASCDGCGKAQADCPNALVIDLLDWSFNLYPYNCAEVLLDAKAAMDIIADVAARKGRYASYITEDVLNKNQFCMWPGRNSERMVGVVTDGIGVFIANVMSRVRALMAGKITAITIFKFANERDDGNYIFAGVAVNGIWLMTDGMTDFSGSGGRAYADLSVVLKFWAWLYGVDIETSHYDHAAYRRLMANFQTMFDDEY
jgi:hypothetical protein